MKTKFTPGPWTANSSQIKAGRRLVATAKLDPAAALSSEANARLIAAAPELYAALDSAESRLTAALSIVRQFCKVTGEKTLLAACEANGETQDIRAALAKVHE